MVAVKLGCSYLLPMALKPSTPQRLADLLNDPRETLSVELKGWLDLAGNNEHKALLAKAIIALANHGGGAILIGFSKTDSGSGPAPGRPGSLTDYNSDVLNAVVSKYCDPKFHCDITIHKGPDGLEYPIVNVPGGHKVPVRSTRDGPNGDTIKRNSYYIRRIGPASEVPQDGQEWDELIRRVVANAREDLLDQFRAIMAGGVEAAPEPAQVDRTDEWFAASLQRWQELVSTLPADHAARMKLGHFAIAYTLSGTFKRPTLVELRKLIGEATLRHTGWPEFWMPTRRGIEPYINDGLIECWIGGDKEHEGRDPAHADFWRISPEGKAFLIRGFQEDGRDFGTKPGAAFELTMPSWRTGEGLLHASGLAALLGDPEAEVVFTGEWTGLKGRELVVHPSSNRWLFGGNVGQQDEYRATVTAKADEIPTILPELVFQILAPLYETFGFFQLPANLPAEELAKMRRSRL